MHQTCFVEANDNNEKRSPYCIASIFHIELLSRPHYKIFPIGECSNHAMTRASLNCLEMHQNINEMRDDIDHLSDVAHNIRLNQEWALHVSLFEDSMISIQYGVGMRILFCDVFAQ